MLCCCQPGLLSSSSSLLRRSCVALLPCRCSTDCLLLRRERTEREQEMMRETEREAVLFNSLCLTIHSAASGTESRRERERGGKGGERRARERRGKQRGWRADCCWQPDQSKCGRGNMGVAWGQWKQCRAGQVYNVSLALHLTVPLDFRGRQPFPRRDHPKHMNQSSERCLNAERCLTIFL